MPRPSQLRELLRFRRASLHRNQARLARAQTIEDLRRIASRTTPRGPFDYVDGAADGEISLLRARRAFEDIEWHPSVLRDVAEVDTVRSVLGAPSALPFGIAPTGFTRMMHSGGESVVAAAAGDAGIPFSLSSVGTTTPEAVAAANPTGRNWFQLYMWSDRERSLDLIHRAAAAGFDTLLVTVDVPVAGARLRDVRNGLTVPPTLGLKAVLEAAPKVRWWWDFLTTEPLTFATFDRWDGTVAELLDSMFDPTVTLETLSWVMDRWPGKVVVKGVQTVEDARRVARLGVDGIVLSNHGGRQLDRAPVPFLLLPHVVREVGSDTEVLLDTGVMNGADVVASLALGARFTLVGRAYLYGLMAGGGPGVERAIQILASQVERTMRLLGVTDLDELSPRHVTQLQLRPVPEANHSASDCP